jgi:hypothetical protein
MKFNNLPRVFFAVALAFVFATLAGAQERIITLPKEEPAPRAERPLAGPPTYICAWTAEDLGYSGGFGGGMGANEFRILLRQEMTAAAEKAGIAIHIGTTKSRKLGAVALGLSPDVAPESEVTLPEPERVIALSFAFTLDEKDWSIRIGGGDVRGGFANRTIRIRVQATATMVDRSGNVIKTSRPAPETITMQVGKDVEVDVASGKISFLKFFGNVVDYSERNRPSVSEGVLRHIRSQATKVAAELARA